MAVNRFTATWGQDCNSCPNWIEEGDEAGYVEDEIVCGECCDEADNEEAEQAEGWGSNVQRSDS